MEIKSSGILRVFPSRDLKTELKVSSEEITIKSLTESKKYKFDKILPKSASNSDLWDHLCRGRCNLLSNFFSGVSSSVITYGEVNTGKTFSLFGPENGFSVYSYILSEIFKSHYKSLGISIWEILYSTNDRAEQIIDLLKISDYKPLPHTLTSDFITVEINNAEEGDYVFECSKELSPNWKIKSEGGYRCLNNRSHFFIRIAFEKTFIYIIDLAGALPCNLSPEVRVKLGSDEQLNNTRVGLNQFRSILWELAKNPEASVDLLTSSRKSKLSLVISPILASGKNIFVSTIKEDSQFEDIVKTLDVLNRAQNIRILPQAFEIPNRYIPMSLFIQRHKVAKYWEFRPKSEKFEEKKEEIKEFSKNNLKEKISQMILELDETPIAKEKERTSPIYSNSFEIPYEKNEISYVNEKFDENVEEIKAQYEIEIENLRLENLGLKQKIRTIQDNSNFVNIFTIYEEEIRKLENTIKVLREEHVLSITSIEKNIEITDNDNEEILILQQKYKKNAKDLTNQIKSLNLSLIDKEKELSEIKKNERKWQLSRKCFENISKKSVVLENVVGKQSKFLQNNESTFQEMIEELEKLNKELENQRKVNKKLVEENELMIEELNIMKDIASTSGMPEETLKRIHKNLVSPVKVQGNFLISLIHRLQGELTEKKHVLFLDNIIHEVELISKALEQSQTREKNLFEILLELQKRIDKDDSVFARETNKLLRKTLISQLIV